jgi:hypothetical protein
MPTNLPPDYYEVEKRFRAAESTAEKISLLEEMYSVVPKHKGTEHLKSARVWGSSAFDGQVVPCDYVLQDGDVVELEA